MGIVAVSIGPVETMYSNCSETICHGKTCTSYLMSQMGNRTLNVSCEKPEICNHANWAECHNCHVSLVDTQW